MKFFALLVLSSLSLPAFSQSCYVDMIVRNSGRVVRSFSSWGDSTCREGMKECRKSIRFDYSNSPQYPNGSLDCVRASSGGYNPYPNPNPGPIPNPYPNPYPAPYQSVDVQSLILDLSQAVSSSEIKTKIIESAVVSINSYALMPLVRVCSGARTWMENASCLEDGVRRAPREVTDESVASEAVAEACVKATSWMDEANCFKASIRNNRFQSISYLAQSCLGMYGSESSARCFRSVFGAR